jgi:hypothetical protein
MVTTVTVPNNKAKMASGNPQDQYEYLVGNRMLIDRTQVFIEDDKQIELVNWGAGSSKGREIPNEFTEQWRANGQGTNGIFTVVEPADLKLYKSYIKKPLSMPDKPEVSFSLVDYHRGNPIARYQEGWIMIKAKRPDGKEAWYSVSVPVPNLNMCWMGVVWGIPKYVADEMTITPTRNEVKYNGEMRYSLELTPGPVKNKKKLEDYGMFGMDNALTFVPRKDGSTVLINWFNRGGDPRPVGVAEWVTGMVKIYVRPQDPWAGLIKPNSVAPGVYQRIIPEGKTGDFVWAKVKIK